MPGAKFSISRDLTGVLPLIIRQGLLIAKWSCGLSRTQLRKLGLLPQRWKDKRWKKRGPHVAHREATKPEVVRRMQDLYDEVELLREYIIEKGL